MSKIGVAIVSLEIGSPAGVIVPRSADMVALEYVVNTEVPTLPEADMSELAITLTSLMDLSVMSENVATT